MQTIWDMNDIIVEQGETNRQNSFNFMEIKPKEKNQNIISFHFGFQEEFFASRKNELWEHFASIRPNFITFVERWHETNDNNIKIMKMANEYLIIND